MLKQQKRPSGKPSTALLLGLALSAVLIGRFYITSPSLGMGIGKSRKKKQWVGGFRFRKTGRPGTSGRRKPCSEVDLSQLQLSSGPWAFT